MAEQSVLPTDAYVAWARGPGSPEGDSLVDGPLTASALLGNLLNVQIVGPLPRRKESGTLRVGTSHPGPPGSSEA